MTDGNQPATGRSMDRRSSGAGFTLLEVTISLLVLSMILLATSTALRTFAASRGAVGAVVERVENIRLFSGFLRRTLGGALPVTSLSDANIGRHNIAQSEGADRRYGVAFAGNRSSLIWVAPFSAGTALGGVHLLRLAQEESDLVLRWAPWRGPSEEVFWSRSARHVVMQDVESFTLGYRPGFDREWLASWEGEASNPAAVRVSIKTDGRFLPEIIVALNDGRMNQR